MNEYLCHDFKTPRTDTSRRLPSTFRFIPIMFYVAVVGCTYMMTMDYFEFKKAQQQKIEAEGRKRQLVAERDAFQAELAGLEAEGKKADGVAVWMEGARNLQPILVKIARAVQMETRLGAVSLERSEQAPANISLSMKVTGANAATEIAAIQNALGQLQYRAYSPQQTKNDEVIEYHSTVIRDTQ